MNGSSLYLPPRSALSPFVDTIRVVSGDAEEERQYVALPDGRVDLVLRIREVDSDVHTLGARLRVLRKGVTGVPQSIAVRFKPGGAYPFFGVPMNELTQRIVPLRLLWGAPGIQLREQVTEATTLESRLRLVEEALLERLRRNDVFEPASAHLARRAVRILSGATEAPRIDALARTLGVSERQLRRVFETVVGMGPKAFARVVRFQRAVRASWEAARPDWAAIAIQSGYYDQAHLISEFRELAGMTPGTLVRERGMVTTAPSP